MTVRAVVLGLLVAAIVAAVGYINDFVLDLTYLVGNHFPVFVFGGLVLFLLLVNPLLRLVKLALSAKEVATVVILSLTIGVIPGSGLLRTFSATLAMPANLAAQTADWQRNHILSYVPQTMLATTVDDPRVLGPYLQGMASSTERIHIGQVPWTMAPVLDARGHEVLGPDGQPMLGGWQRPLTFWVPLVAVTFIGLLALGTVVHRQWASNELLRYPIVEFAHGVMQRDEGRLLARVFYNRLFWIGVAVPVFIHLVNGWFTISEGKGIQIVMNLDMSAPLRELWPNLEKGGRWWGVSSPRLWITVAAFSYLLASEIGLSLGLSNLAFTVTAAILYGYGIETPDDYWMGGVFSYQTFGSYVGAMLIILYTGRNHYWAVLRRAFWVPARQAVPGYSVWGARVFLLCMAGAVAWLRLEAGIDLPMAILVMSMITLMLLVIGRINAETGLFFIQPGWPIMGSIAGLFGMEALGAKAFILLGLVVTVLAVDPRESIMPYILNSLKLGDKVDLRPGRIAPWMGAAVLLGLAVGIPAVLWAQYNYGVNYVNDEWGVKTVPSHGLKAASLEIDKLKSAGVLGPANDPLVARVRDVLVARPQATLEEVVREVAGPASPDDPKWEQNAEAVRQAYRLREGYNERGGWQRFLRMRPNRTFLTTAGMGVAVVLLLNWARLRWTWWPIHPVLFLVWYSVPMAHFAASFLLGWIVRTMVVKVGGGKAYQNVKPLMYGLIAGDLLGGMFFMSWGAWRFATTGTKFPKVYQIFPF